jgi:hypothetical protein
MNFWSSDFKLYLLSGGVFALSLSTIEISLKILLLLVSIFYTLYKWYNLKKDEDK